MTALLGSCTDSLVEPRGAHRQPDGRAHGDPLCRDQYLRAPPTKWTWAWDLFFNSENTHRDAVHHRRHTRAEGQEDGRARSRSSTRTARTRTSSATVEWPGATPRGMAGRSLTTPRSPPDTRPTSPPSLQAAKAAGADMLLVDHLSAGRSSRCASRWSPSGYNPKIVVARRRAAGRCTVRPRRSAAWRNGVMVGGYWDPSIPFPGALPLMQRVRSPNTHRRARSTSPTRTRPPRSCSRPSPGRARSTRRRLTTRSTKTNGMFVAPASSSTPSTHRIYRWSRNSGRTARTSSSHRSTGLPLKVLFPLPTG